MRGRFRRAAGAVLLSGCGGGRLRSCVPPSRPRAGRGVPVSRVIARACARGRGRAYRGGAARAPDCARETADAPRPSVPAGVFFAAPSRRFLQKSRKAAPGEPPLSTFILHHMGESQARPGTENENTGDFSWIADGMEARTGARRPSPVMPPPIMPPSVMPVITSPGMTIWGRRAWRCRAGGGFPAVRYAPPAGQSPSRASLTEASSPCRLTISS